MKITHNEDADWLIETERLRLRPVTIGDTTLMLAVWNDPAFIRHVADRGIRTDVQAKEALQAGALKLFADFGYGPYCLSLKSNGDLIGICGLFRRENLDDPDIGFSVLPEHCGRGYANEAASAVIKYAKEVLGITRLTALVSPKNVPSIGLIEKLGLTFNSLITMPGDDEAIRLYKL